MRAHYDEYSSLLKKFLNHIESTKIIAEYIKDCGELPDNDIKSEIDAISESYGDLIFDIGSTVPEEVAKIYHILAYCSKNNIDIPTSIALSYSTSSKFHDATRGFNERVVMVLIRHIEAYLTKIGIEMGFDEHVSYSITLHKGQVNVATDQATITASQGNVGASPKPLEHLIKDVLQHLPKDLSPEVTETVEGSLDSIKSELMRENPRPSRIRSAIAALRSLKGMAEFSATMIPLIEYVQRYLQ